MSDPLAIFPKDQSGRLRSGAYKRIPFEELKDAIKHGYRPVPTNDGLAYHHNEYGVLCRMPTRRPWWQRVMAMFRKVPL